MKDLSYELFFKALSNTTRIRIIESLKNKPLKVSQICDLTKFEQSRVSHNLKILETLGFLKSKKEGKTKIYKLENHIKPILKQMDVHIEKYKDKLCTCGILNGKKTCRHLKEEIKNGKKKHNQNR